MFKNNITKYFRNITEYFTFLTGELRWALAGVLVDSVSAGSPVLTHVVGAVVHVSGAVLTHEP